MEALGAAASVAGLISLALEVPKLIDTLIRIRSAPEEAREMSKTAGALVETLQKLEAFLKTEDAREMGIADDSALMVSLSVCQSKVLNLSKRLRSQSCAAPSPSSNAASNALKAAAIRFQWPLDRKECFEIISELRAMECTFQFCLVMQNCQQMSKSHKEVVSHLRTQSETLSQMAASFPEQAASAKSMVEKLDMIGTCVSRASQEIDRVQIRLQELEGMKNDLAELYADKLHGQVLEWLSPIDPSARHEELKCARVDGTCEWISTDATFQRWVQDPPSEHLDGVTCWVGDPGQGKTFTMSRIVDYLDEYRRFKSETYVTYLYCDYQRTSNYSVTALVGALVRQLLCSFRKVPDQIATLFRQAHIKQRRSSCRMDEMKQVMQFLKPHVKRLFLCIDALDEYKEAISLVSACHEFPVPTSFFFIGRQSIAQVVKHSFSEAVERVLDHQTADIRAVVSTLVEKEMTYRPELMPNFMHNDIIAEVGRLANGMFLLASLHANLVLSHNTVYKRQEALRDLPTTLDSTFTRTLARIREQVQVSQALTILAWIHHVGPMSLDKLRYALAIEPHHMQFHEDNLPDTKTMLDCCLGLVRLDTSQRVSVHTKVTLVHSTLSVFFDSRPAILEQSLSVIADTCLTYLLLDQDKRPEAISSVVNGSWVRLLRATRDLSPMQQDKACKYCKLLNKRLIDECKGSLESLRELPGIIQGLPSQAQALVSQEVPAHFAGERSRGQTLLHTACMLGLDSCDPIIDHIADDVTCSGALGLNGADMFGLSPLGWTLLSAKNIDDSGQMPALSKQDSYEHNILRAEHFIRKFPCMDPNQPLWDVVALDAIRTSGARYQGATRIEYFARLPFLFFLSNYSYSSEAIERCMSLMESHLNFNLWSALRQSLTSDPTGKGLDAPAADGLAEQEDQRWILVTLDNEATRDKSWEDVKRRRHEAEPPVWPLVDLGTDGPWPGSELDKPRPVTGSMSVLVRRELVALFKPRTTIPALVAANWQQDPVSTYCAARTDITETSSRPLPGTSCRILFLPHESLLHVGVAADSVSVVKFALSVFRVNPNLLDHNGTTALRLALMLGSKSTADFLIKYDGIDLVSCDVMGQSPLHLCAQSRYQHRLDMLKTASSILSKCTSALNLQDNAGKTALHYAVETGNRRMISLLLRYNRADVNIQDASGHTPLHTAILRRDMNICEIILEQSSGSPISSDNLRVAWGLTTSAGANFILPLLRFVGVLVKHQAVPDSQNPLLSLATGHDQGLLRLVQAASQSPDFTENDLNFMLALESTHSASRASTVPGAVVLGSGRASTDPADATKTIKAAIFKGAGSVAAYLLRMFSVDLNHLEEDGESTLHLAVVYNATQAIQFLLARSDIDVNSHNSEGYTALHLTVVRKRQDILQMLLDCPRVEAGQVHNSSGATALTLAIKHRFAEGVPMLLAAHQRISVNHLDRTGSSALHYAVMQDDTATVRLLLGCPGLMAASPSHDGRTALAYAAMSAGMEMVTLLLETGNFDLDHRDSYGKTAFDWAQMNPCVEVAEILKIPI